MKTASMPPTPVPAMRIAAPTAASTPSSATVVAVNISRSRRQGDRDDERGDERERDAPGTAACASGGTAAATSGQPNPATATTLAATSAQRRPAAPSRHRDLTTRSDRSGSTAGRHRERAGREARRRTRRRGSRTRTAAPDAAAATSASPTSSRAAASSPRVGSSTSSTLGMRRELDREHEAEPLPRRQVAWVPAQQVARLDASRGRGSRANRRGRRRRRAVGATALLRDRRREQQVVERLGHERDGATAGAAAQAVHVAPATITRRGRARRAIACSRLDLPAPFGPRSATSSPARSVKLDVVDRDPVAVRAP